VGTGVSDRERVDEGEGMMEHKCAENEGAGRCMI